MKAHQYVERETGGVVTEHLFGDRVVRFLYSRARERAPALFRAATGARMSHLLGLLHFDLPLAPRLAGNRRFLAACGVDLGECLDDPRSLDTPRKLFERRIRYWDCRPLPAERAAVVSPADSRVVVGSLGSDSALFVKEKFFGLEQLLGEPGPDGGGGVRSAGREPWARRFLGGDFAIFRLTPDKYHYTHTPVAGWVADFYELAGSCHSCNPGAVVELVTPYSLNRRVVTVLDTDLYDGTGVGLVAMVEVVAMMVGQVVQAYCRERYEEPVPVEPGLFVERGCPKGLFRPGSSTVVLLFEPGRVRFAGDLVDNRGRADVASRFSLGFGQALAETDVKVRSLVGLAR
jgi:phosphatidylserine decarboxylase